MHKGFIYYQNTKIPFIINDFKMELFTQDAILDAFNQKYRFSTNFVLTGECIFFGNNTRKITMLVDEFAGYTYYLSCFIVHHFEIAETFNEICFRSQVLDSIFQYKYHFLDMSRNGVNLSASENILYTFPINVDTNQHNLQYIIGSKHTLGLLDDFDNTGKTIVTLAKADIFECKQIVTLIERFSSFMTSHPKITFNHITLLRNGFSEATFYCKQVSDDSHLNFDIHFCSFSISTYVPKILQHLSLELDASITQSIPLGHLGEFNNPYAPQRFIEQVIAFEYLFEKLEPVKATDKKFHLKDELKLMLDEFSQILLNHTRYTSDSLSEDIKELRRTITHGYEYYYTFAHDNNKKFLVDKMARLLRCMSLKLIGFSAEEIKDFIP